ncbi:MAG: 4-alpha-glucanotransferase [Chitinophagaceae bacterium]|nr:4-alpha-glucanotransferase [Chitinophagaceae bacterium]
MKIHFYLRFHTNPGQSLSVIGNCAELGNNDMESAVPLQYLNNDYWQGIVEIDTTQVVRLSYKYILKNADGYTIVEWGDDKSLDLSKTGIEEIQVIDAWNHSGEFENAFYTDPFQKVLLKGNETKLKVKTPKNFSHIFKVKAPLLRKNEVLCLIGAAPSIGEWDTSTPTLLQRENGWWAGRVSIPKEAFPLTYKYGIYNVKSKEFVRFEDGANRVIFGDASTRLTVLHDGFAYLPNSSWKGAGVAMPVFSLRSKNSFGTGEFPDLKLLVDWSVKTGNKVIQILPVNDTTATGTWEDSYPYAAISAFALHPLYLNIATVAGKDYADSLRPLRKKQKQLNDLPDLEYEEVLKFKISILKELFAVMKEDFLQDPTYLEFFEHNRYWLVPYAAFCYLRDRNGTSDFNKWKVYGSYNKASIEKYVSPKAKHYDEIAFTYFVQFHLHLQLKDAADYAHENGVILKGDIPIGIYRYGCDAWMEPSLYHMEMQAGAPPDGFAIHGQNWGFPTYNWEKMAEDGFEWWHRRFVQMGNYFDAFRIDHVLGFFRIWSIPIYSVEGIMGRFVPASPVHIYEFGQHTIAFNHYRLCSPYINDTVLWEMFGPNNNKFKPFMRELGDGHYELKEEYSTQQKVMDWYLQQDPTDDSLNIRQGLFTLLANVILFEEEGSSGQHFHFRFNMEATSSFRYLDLHSQYHLKELYVDYFYRRQDDFWMKEAMKKLPALKASTNMLICGEDLGMVPHCVPDVMKQLGILSLEIQRMPKAIGKEFFHPADAPYMSVVTPSTHDMSTIRGWWEEDRAKTQRFYNTELGQWGEAPPFCEPWISRAIILQHFYSPAMWSIFQLQDLLGMSETIRRPNPHEERINIPANSKHFWKYRMHLTLEQLLKEKDFNNELLEFLEASGRA